jgi:hypothetical protein
MSRITSIVSVLVALLLVLVLAPAAGVEASLLEDQRIANDVAARLSGDSSFSAIRITTQNGVVYLTGPVDSAATGARATQIARQVVGVRQVVNQLQLASSAPPTVVSTTTPTVVTVITPPAAPASSGSAVIPGQPPVDVQGTVTAYDPNTRIVTLQDGRMVRVQAGSVWQSSSLEAIQPGRQIYARNAEPIGIQTSQPGAWRIGTVDRVDQANGLLYLRDGAVVGLNATTPVTMNGQRVTLSQIRPGAQIAVRVPDTATALSQHQIATGGSALPRSVVSPFPSAEIVVFP